jgi:hypothetical protein
MRRRRSFGRSAGAAAALAVTVLSVLVLSPVAGALSARFVVNDGDTYARRPRVTAGDGGWSPFFRPAVVVWDGGSIVAGHRADPGYDFPTQTLSLVPRVCESYVSYTAGAKIADMLFEAPSEVDARFRSGADLNLCVVQAGGGDFREGASAADVYNALKSYCSERRAEGFRVVVLTVLPASGPVTFEATRLAYDALLRSSWGRFADGLVDVGADGRIGDTGDNLDRQFYQSDAVHLTNAGNAVMASVAAPALNAQPWLSLRCEMRLRDGAGAWGDWLPYTGARTLDLAGGDGLHVVGVEYRLDGGPPVSDTDDIFVDTVRPTPLALRDVVAQRGHPVRLPFRVDDAPPCGPTCTVVVRLTTPRGRVLRTFVRRLVPVGERSTVTFTGGLDKGTYRYDVSARDSAGNPQSAVAVARLSVL